MILQHFTMLQNMPLLRDENISRHRVCAPWVHGSLHCRVCRGGRYAPFRATSYVYRVNMKYMCRPNHWLGVWRVRNGLYTLQIVARDVAIWRLSWEGTRTNVQFVRILIGGKSALSCAVLYIFDFDVIIAAMSWDCRVTSDDVLLAKEL